MTQIRSAPNEIKMCIICTSNVSCGNGEMVSGATGGQFCTYADNPKTNAEKYSKQGTMDELIYYAYLGL